MSRIPPNRIASVGLASVLLLGGAPAVSAAAATEASALDARFVSTTADAPTLPLIAAEVGEPSTPSAHALRSSGLDAGTLLGFWVGGGALALATAGVLVSVTKRRVRRETDPSV